jgi:pimeloyl-ACP methyl ester carboxylesterase
MTRQFQAAERGRRSASPLDRFERDRLALFARYGFEGRSRWVSDREGRRTYVIGRGEGRCPTVLVHGGLSEASEWSLLAGRLPGHVVIPDRPGCGLSYRIDYRGVADYREAAAAWLLDLADGVGAGQVDLVGNSMGGFFAMAFAIAYPDRVRRLVLVGYPAGLANQVPLFARLWGSPVTGPLISKLKITDPETYRKQVFARLLVAHPETVPLDLLEMMVAAAALPGADRAAYTMLRAVTTLRGWRPKLMLRDGMASLPVPTLFLWGGADAFGLPPIGQGLAARMPDARFEVLPDTGHLPQIDRADTVASAIIGFLATQTQTSHERSWPGPRAAPEV